MSTYKRSISEEPNEFVKIYDSQTKQRIILTTKLHTKNMEWREKYNINLFHGFYLDLDNDEVIPSTHVETKHAIVKKSLSFAEYATKLFCHTTHGKEVYDNLHLHDNNMDGDDIVVDVDNNHNNNNNNNDGATSTSGSNNNDNNNTTASATTRSQMTNQFPYDYIVCCVNGRSRTPTAYLAFMMLFRRQRSEVATEFIKEACQDQRVSMNASSKSMFPNFIKFKNVISYLEKWQKELEDISFDALYEIATTGLSSNSSSNEMPLVESSALPTSIANTATTTTTTTTTTTIVTDDDSIPTMTPNCKQLILQIVREIERYCIKEHLNIKDYLTTALKMIQRDKIVLKDCVETKNGRFSHLKNKKYLPESGILTTKKRTKYKTNIWNKTKLVLTRTSSSQSSSSSNQSQNTSNNSNNNTNGHSQSPQIANDGEDYKVVHFEDGSWTAGRHVGTKLINGIKLCGVGSKHSFSFFRKDNRKTYCVQALQAKRKKHQILRYNNLVLKKDQQRAKQDAQKAFEKYCLLSDGDVNVVDPGVKKTNNHDHSDNNNNIIDLSINNNDDINNNKNSGDALSINNNLLTTTTKGSSSKKKTNTIIGYNASSTSTTKEVYKIVYYENKTEWTLGLHEEDELLLGLVHNQECKIISLKKQNKTKKKRKKSYVFKWKYQTYDYNVQAMQYSNKFKQLELCPTIASRRPAIAAAKKALSLGKFSVSDMEMTGRNEEDTSEESEINTSIESTTEEIINVSPIRVAPKISNSNDDDASNNNRSSSGSNSQKKVSKAGKRVCTVPECNKYRTKRGLCNEHHQKFVDIGFFSSAKEDDTSDGGISDLETSHGSPPPQKKYKKQKLSSQTSQASFLSQSSISENEDSDDEDDSSEEDSDEDESSSSSSDDDDENSSNKSDKTIQSKETPETPMPVQSSGSCGSNSQQEIDRNVSSSSIASLFRANDNKLILIDNSTRKELQKGINVRLKIIRQFEAKIRNLKNQVKSMNETLKTIGSDNISSNSNDGNGRGNKKQSQRSPRIVIKKKTKKRHRNDDDHGPGTSSDDSKRSKKRVKKI